MMSDTIRYHDFDMPPHAACFYNYITMAAPTIRLLWSFVLKARPPRCLAEIHANAVDNPNNLKQLIATLAPSLMLLGVSLPFH